MREEDVVMITMILAEKETQARAYAKSLGLSRKEGRVHIVKSSPYFSGEVRIIAAEGHLFEYQLPKDNWHLDKLPLVDVSFKQSLKTDKGSKEIFKQIYQEVTIANQIVIGTDSDREGERIAYSILTHIPGGKEKIKYRLWIRSMTETALKKAFQNMRRPSETYNFYLEAEARAQADWLVGMNLSPLATINLQEKNQLKKKKQQVFSVGRVQTPAVRILCENDLAIQNFKAEPYWKLKVEDKETGVVFRQKDKYLTSEALLLAVNQLSVHATVSSLETKEHTIKAPALFNLSDAQGFMAKKYGFDSLKTENIIEKLYLKGYVSYPRTDSRLIFMDEFKYLRNFLTAYQEAIRCNFEPEQLEPRDFYVNNASEDKNASHYALIPTENIPDLKGLSKDEQIVYEAIVRQTILMFAGDCRYKTKTITLENNGFIFKTVGREVLDLGWVSYSKQKIKKDVALPAYKVGDVVAVESQVTEHLTKAPKRLTESELIAQVLPNYNLGTQATRAAIIKTIQDRGYAVKDKKSGQLLPTDKAYLLIHYLYGNEFTNPETTAGWEIFLSQIGEGKINPREFVDAIKDKIVDQVLATKESEGER